MFDKHEPFIKRSCNMLNSVFCYFQRIVLFQSKHEVKLWKIFRLIFFIWFLNQSLIGCQNINNTKNYFINLKLILSLIKIINYFIKVYFIYFKLSCFYSVSLIWLKFKKLNTFNIIILCFYLLLNLLKL